MSLCSRHNEEKSLIPSCALCRFEIGKRARLGEELARLVLDNEESGEGWDRCYSKAQEIVLYVDSKKGEKK